MLSIIFELLFQNIITWYKLHLLAYYVLELFDYNSTRRRANNSKWETQLYLEFIARSVKAYKLFSMYCLSTSWARIPTQFIAIVRVKDMSDKKSHGISHSISIHDSLCNYSAIPKILSQSPFMSMMCVEIEWLCTRHIMIINRVQNKQHIKCVCEILCVKFVNICGLDSRWM